MKPKLILLLATLLFLFSACQYVSMPEESIDVQKTPESIQGQETADLMALEKPTQHPSIKPTKTYIPVSTEQPAETIVPETTPAPLTIVEPTVKPTEMPTTRPSVSPTEVPTATPSPTPTPQPTPEPTTEPKNEITPVSSSFVHEAMAEINRLRKANGVSPATLSYSLSLDCQNHAELMAKSGSSFHANGMYVYEAVGKVSKYMPGEIMGGTAANHVVQLQSNNVTEIGIGAVFYGDYIFFVVRGE